MDGLNIWRILAPLFLTGVLSLVLLLPPDTHAQLPTTCPNSNFSTGTFENWTGCYGTFNNPCATPGFDTTGPQPLHSIIPAPGFLDPNTCMNLLTVYTGEAYSARLGHQIGGAHAAQLKYDIVVSEENYLFIYRYAIVLQDPGHNPGQQPSFTIEVQDTDGTVLDSTCGYYYVYAQPGLPEWRLCELPGTDCVWKDWTTVGMDLTPYINKTIRIVFTIRDCSLGGHFGYAYISTYCDFLQMEIALCEGDSSASLTAPPGFYYYWYTVNGDTTINGNTNQSIVISNPVTGDEYFCELTAFNGCMVTISQVLSYTVVQANFTYTPNCATYPVSFFDSSTINQNQVTNWKWDFGDGSPPLTGIQNPTHTYTNAGTYNVQLIAFSTEGCRDTILKPVVVDTLPFLANDTLRKAICSNTFTDITLSSGGPGTFFTWMAFASSPNLSGYSNNSTPSTYLNDSLVNTGNQVDSVLYTISPENSSCTGFDTVYTVLVYPSPQLTNFPLAKILCDSTYTDITLTSGCDSTLFTWTVTPGAGYITGYADNTAMPTTYLNQQLLLSGVIPDSILYHITPHAFGCNGPVTDYQVTVNPFPAITNHPMFDTICDLNSPMLTLEATCDGSTFAWTAQLGFGSVTGFANGSGPLINQTLDNLINVTGEVRYLVTPVAYGCPGPDTTFYILVNPTAHLINNPLGDTICSGETTGIPLYSDVSPAGFIWSCTPSSPDLSGFSDNSIPADSIVQTIFNTGSTAETVTFHITPVTDGCNGDTTDFVLSVNPEPDVSIDPAYSSLCDNTSTGIALTGNVAGTVFTWTAGSASPGISGYGPGTGNLIQQTLYNGGYVPGEVIYQIIPVANGCTGLPDSAIVAVNPMPVVSFTACFDTITTTDAQPIRLRGGTPVNGTYTGTGVSSQQFFPALAGPGTHIITYTYINDFSCMDSAQLTIINYQFSIFNCGDSLTDIRDSRKYPTVLIGTQCWMAANLNRGAMILSGILQQDNCITEKYCYDDILLNCTQYGGLYQWDEMMAYAPGSEPHGICPGGWHVPSETEWGVLFSCFVSHAFAGSALKSSGYSGFNALMSGIRFHHEVWKYPANDPVLRSKLYWSSTGHTPQKAWAHGMNEVVVDAEYTPSVSFYPALRSHAFAVRCLKD